jgi:hypothetical protein
MQPRNHQTKKIFMKNRIQIILIFTLFSLTSFAQSDAEISIGDRFSFGIYGGINFMNINGTNPNGNALSNSLVPRFTLGINEEIYVAPEFYVQIGLQYITKGTTGNVDYKDLLTTRSITRELNLKYIEMPINLLYKQLVGKGKLILGFGPYIGYCIGGTAIFSGNSAPEDTDLKIQEDVPNNENNNLIYFKTMDIGANFLVGYQLANGINLTLNSQLGLVNINSNSSSSLANKNTGFGLILGYRF